MTYRCACSLAILLLACRTPPPDFSRQKLLQIAVLLNYEHPSAYRDAARGLERAVAELSQVHAVIFGPPPPTPAIKAAPESRTHTAWKKRQVQQIIEQDYDVLVLFGDEQIDLDESLRTARAAGLILVYCGFSGKPLINRASPRYRQQPRFLNESTAENLPYISEEGEAMAIRPPILSDEIPAQAEVAKVHINIRPASMAALASHFRQFLLELQQPAALLLFGPSELPFTRAIYRQLRPSIRARSDYIHAVRFLDPLRMESQDEIRHLIRELPAEGRIIALEPLLLYSSAQILQRYSTSLKLAGLGWQQLPDNVEFLVPLEYGALSYAAVYAAFALYSGEKRGRSGEFFFLGGYGQRQLGSDGSLVLSKPYSESRSFAGLSDLRPDPKRPARFPQNPRRRSILSENDLRY